MGGDIDSKSPSMLAYLPAYLPSCWTNLGSVMTRDAYAAGSIAKPSPNSGRVGRREKPEENRNVKASEKKATMLQRRAQGAGDGAAACSGGEESMGQASRPARLQLAATQPGVSASSLQVCLRGHAGQGKLRYSKEAAPFPTYTTYVDISERRLSHGTYSTACTSVRLGKCRLTRPGRSS